MILSIKNSQGHVVSATDNGGTMSYAHDPFGNLRSVTNVDATVTSMTYDIRGRKTAMNDPNMGAWSYAYNVLGELVSQTDAKGQTVTMSFDKLGRMVSRTLPNSEGTSTWTFDTATKGIGKLASVSNPNANETYTYDSLGRLGSHTTSVSGITYSVTTTYDALSRIDTLTYPETGFRLKHIYDANQLGFLREVKNDATGASLWKINAGGVDAFNRIVNETYGNGLTTQREYAGGTGDLNFIKTGPSGSPTSVQNETYGFDELGNVTARGWWDGTAQRSETFGYDNLNRLTSVTGPASKTYSYAANGNLTYKSDVGTYAYSTGGVRPHAVSSIAGIVNTSFTYDANGNMLSGNGRTLTYTSFNKPKTIAQGGNTSTLTYDAGFNRVIKSNANGTTVYIGKLYERVTSGSTVTQRHYIYAGPNVVGQYTQTSASTTTRYFHTDHLGSVAVITNESGGIVQRLSYDAHGKRRNADGTDATAGQTGQTYTLDTTKLTTGSVFTTFLAKGSEWAYLDNGSNQGTAWRATAFNDSSWSRGRAELGYGDGDEATVVSFGPDPNNKYITTYFRSSFHVTDPTQVTSLALGIRRDDGAVLYLNGAEVARSNITSGTITYTTRAQGAGSETTYYPFTLDPARLVTGANAMAVEVHQSSPSSSDLSFDLELTGNVSTTYYLVKTGDTWAGIASALYGSASVSDELEQALGRPALAAGTQLTNLPATLTDTPSGGAIAAQTTRGFTRHEHDDEVGLINMNAREYDPLVGRFLTPDTLVQFPYSSQGMNRYSYVNNNPLSFTDPTGHGLGKKIKKAIQRVADWGERVVERYGRTIAAIGVTFIPGLNVYAAGFLSGTIASGGNLRAGLIGAFSVGLLSGPIHNMNAGWGKVLAHGMVGGARSELLGGDFKSGFLSGGFTQAASWSGAFDGLGDPSTLPGRAANAFGAAFVGGIGSVVGGGRFADGAVTGAFSRMFNDLKNFLECKGRCHGISGMGDREPMPAEEQEKLGKLTLMGLATFPVSGGVGVLMTSGKVIEFTVGTQNAFRAGWALTTDAVTTGVVAATPVITNPAAQQAFIDFVEGAAPGGPPPTSLWGIGGALFSDQIEKLSGK